jgi:hypothetical protein
MPRRAAPRLVSPQPQARQQVAGTCQQVSQLYSLVGQATEATGAQLEATHLVLQQAAAKQPLTPPEPPLEPGPGQVRCLTHHLCVFTESSPCQLHGTCRGALLTAGACLCCCSPGGGAAAY